MSWAPCPAARREARTRPRYEDSRESWSAPLPCRTPSALCSSRRTCSRVRGPSVLTRLSLFYASDLEDVLAVRLRLVHLVHLEPALILLPQSRHAVLRRRDR